MTLIAVARAATAGVLCTIVPMVCDVRALRRIPGAPEMTTIMNRGSRRGGKLGEMPDLGSLRPPRLRRLGPSAELYASAASLASLAADASLAAGAGAGFGAGR